MKAYRVKNWEKYYENNRSRTVKDLAWVPIPNRHDGESYSEIISHKNSAIIFAGWILILQVASRCQPRGTLLKNNGIPHTPTSLSIKTRAKFEWFSTAIPVLLQVGWLEEFTVEIQEPVMSLSVDCQAGDEEGRKERTEENGMEQKGMERTETAKHVVEYLNQTTGKRFQNSDESLKPIKARLKEGFTKEDCFGVIDVKVKAWLHDPKMNMYLRPSTLFNAEKFSNYLGEVGAIKPEKPFEF